MGNWYLRASTRKARLKTVMIAVHTQPDVLLVDEVLAVKMILEGMSAR